jgi:hypothetical protein
VANSGASFFKTMFYPSKLTPLEEVVTAIADSAKIINLYDKDDAYLFKAATTDHRMLNLFYIVMRKEFSERMKKRKKELTDPKDKLILTAEEIKYLTHLTKLSYILFHVHDKYLIVKREATRLKEDQKIYFQWLQYCSSNLQSEYVESCPQDLSDSKNNYSQLGLDVDGDVESSTHDEDAYENQLPSPENKVPIGSDVDGDVESSTYDGEYEKQSPVPIPKNKVLISLDPSEPDDLKKNLNHNTFSENDELHDIKQDTFSENDELHDIKQDTFSENDESHDINQDTFSENDESHYTILASYKLDAENDDKPKDEDTFWFGYFGCFGYKNTFDLRKDIRLFYNLLRLLIVRLRRACLMLSFISGPDNTFSAIVGGINSYTVFGFSLGNWVFFIPRLLIQIYLLCQHVFFPAPGSYEQSLGIFERFIVQMSRRWVDLSNDIPWLLVNLTLFALGLPLFSYTSIMINFGITCYDFFVTGLFRLYWEYCCWQELLQICQTDENFGAMGMHLPSLTARYNFEMQVFGYMVLNFAVMILSLSLSLPFFMAISPWLSFAGAVMAVLLTFCTWAMLHYFENKRFFDLNGHEPGVSNVAQYPEPAPEHYDYGHTVNSAPSGAW